MTSSPPCKNYMMNQVGLGWKRAYPRSCPTCSFNGKCTYDVKRDPASKIEEQYYVGYKQDMLAAEKCNAFKYAVIYKDSIHHEGDQRSRDCPGHGYPAWTETIEKIETFKDEEALKQWILRNSTGFSRKSFVAIKYQELKVATEVSVSLG